MAEITNTGAGGATQGATPENLSEGQTTAGAPKLPVDTGNKPVIPAEALNEEHGEDDKAPKEAPKDAPKETPTEQEAPKEEDKSEWHKEYVKFDNPDAQAAVDLLQEAGVSPVEANAAFEKALQTGDLNDIDWAILETKLGPVKTRLVKNGVDKYYTEVYSTQVATVNKVYEIVGGEDNWGTVRQWAQTTEKTDPAFKTKIDGIRKALDAGGYTAELGARELLALYNAAGTTKGLNTKKIMTGDTIPVGVGTPITRSEYVELSQKAYREGKHAEMQALNARRRLGMAQGI